MISCNEFSATDTGTVGHVALAAWLQENLSQTFDTVLHEPLPRALLAILGDIAEFDAGPLSAVGELHGARL